jgi:hypothetical protein
MIPENREEADPATGGVPTDADRRCRQSIEDLMACGRPWIVLELPASRAQQDDTVNQLMTAANTLALRGGRIILLNPPRQVWEALVSRSAASLFSYAESRDEAVEMIGGG